ncbi:cytochrome P450 [Sphingomonas aliaeris]|uniref:cytochrome P450 n=1 Tax=Sphingomonas aliaeris TaxID=2759526 RepID=UPI001CEC366F|nr:cytochrome P450 [Sphingomonas aliaeris]
MIAARLAIDPFDEAFLADPYAHHEALREAGPVVWLDAIGAYGMARHAEVSAALRDHEAFCSGRGVGLSDFAIEDPWRPPSLLLETDPPLHDRTRGIMNKVVSLAALKTLRPRWEQTAEALVDRLVEKRRFDAVTELGEAFPMAVFPDTIGVPEDGRELLLVYAASVFNAFGPRNAVFARGEAEAAPAIGWVAQACKRENLSPDGWGAGVYAAADRGECSEAEAERLVRSFLTAGIDTTVNGIGHLVLALATHPDEYANVRANPALEKRALDESLRWDSTVQTFFRTTTRDVEIAGTTIPEGAKVLLFLAAANRDPRRWNDPDRFVADRPTSGHVGFGFGIHQCLGQMVARLEAEVVLRALVRRVRRVTLAGTPERRLNNTLHAIHRLPVGIEPA